MQIEIKHRSAGAVLFSAEADGPKAALEIAVEREADLGGADLYGAVLCGADLRGADLRGANLIDAGQDRRGYRFIGWQYEGAVRISAGCRNFTLPEAKDHWSTAHESDPALRAECLAKVALIESVAIARGWIAQDKQAA